MPDVATAAPVKLAPKPRPKHLDLTKIRLPLPGWVSIMHRVSGAALFLMIAPLLCLFEMSLSTELSFDSLRGLLGAWWVKVPLMLVVWGYLHHFCAGIRYLLLDLHIGIDLEGARRSAMLVYVFSIPLSALVIWRLFF